MNSLDALLDLDMRLIQVLQTKLPGTTLELVELASVLVKRAYKTIKADPLQTFEFPKEARMLVEQEQAEPNAPA